MVHNKVPKGIPSLLWQMFTDLKKMMSLLNSAVNLPPDLCDIFHHTCNVSLHYIVKSNIENSCLMVRWSTDLSYRCFALLLTINQMILIVCVLLSQIKCYNVLIWHGCMRGNICDTRQFMTSMNWSRIWRRSGVAWHKMSLITQWMSGTDVSGRVFMPKDDILSI